MFDSLSDQMKRDLDQQTSKSERLVEYAIVAVVSIVIFAGLYWGIHALQ